MEHDPQGGERPWWRRRRALRAAVALVGLTVAMIGMAPAAATADGSRTGVRAAVDLSVRGGRTASVDAKASMTVTAETTEAPDTEPDPSPGDAPVDPPMSSRGVRW